MQISVSEENYIKAIYKLTVDDGEEYAGTNMLSKHLNNKAASVTEMLNKLHVKKIIDYKKYQGVKLTKKGLQLALQIVRKHRLWEVFLVDTLRFKWDEVHDIAEQLEHIQSDELIKRLDSFLKFPKQDPHGDPIPNQNGVLKDLQSVCLNEASLNKKYIFTGVKSHTSEFLKHVTKVGLEIGDKIEILSKSEFDDLYSIKIFNKRKQIHLGLNTASNLLMKLA